MVNVVIPMAGLGSRFRDAGYRKIKPFIDVLGKPMIERVVDNLRIPDARYVFVVRREHEAEFEAELGPVMQGTPHEVVYIDLVTEGAACTVLHARRLFDNDRPLLVANSDQIVDIDVAQYVADCDARGLDGSILTFECPEKHTKWSYAALDQAGLVTEVREKVAISTHATVGIYYWTRGKDYVGAAIDMIVNNDRVNGEFYVCPVYNYNVREGSRIGVYDIAPEAMHGTGTPADLDAYIAVIEARAPASAG